MEGVNRRHTTAGHSAHSLEATHHELLLRLEYEKDQLNKKVIGVAFEKSGYSVSSAERTVARMQSVGVRHVTGSRFVC